MQDIRNIPSNELLEFLRSIKEPSFRLQQIEKWLWIDGVSTFDDMTNLSKKMRNNLKTNYCINKIKIAKKLQSKDKSIKYILSLQDNRQIEAVLLPNRDRVTICLSSQVGCSFNCSFCATGKIKNVRNLQLSEIFEQFIRLNDESQKEFKKNISNIVFMGMGEPLANYENVKKFVLILSDKNLLNFSQKRITISTVGIVNGILQMIKDELKVKLAVSLHSTDNKKRIQIIPNSNKNNSLSNLLEVLLKYNESSKEKITIEYTLLKDFNNLSTDAKNLSLLMNKLNGKINLINYNPIKKSKFGTLSKDDIEKFSAEIKKHKQNAIVNIRNSMGEDISAACGQLYQLENKTYHS